MTAAFLYCGGYRDMISSALFELSGVNSNGIYGQRCLYGHLGAKHKRHTFGLLSLVFRC